jgi:tetratricopeptide (TPR) repeat protein
MRKLTQVLLAGAAFALCAVFLTGCSAKAKMARHQQRGDNYYAAGEFSKAEIEYLIALRLDSSNVHTITRLGDIYYQQGRYGRAFPYIQRGCELSTNDVNLQMKLASIYLIATKTKEAREIAEFVLDRSPTNADAPDILAESVTVRTEIEPVHKRLEKLSKQIGETAPLELAFGVLNYASGDLKAAETALQRSITLDPKFSSAYYTLGNLYLTQNKVKEADAAFKTAAELAPVRSPKRLSYANFKIRTGDLAEGKRLMAQINKEAPDYVPAWIRQAEIALAEKRFSDCESLLTQAMARDVDNYDALFLHGRLLLLQGQADKAVTEMSRMAAIFDRSAEVQYQLALAHLAVNDQAKATADLGKALFLNPKYPEAIVLQAGLNITKGDTTAAISALSQLIRQQPQMGEAYMMLGNAYMIQKNLDQALEVYAKASEMFPQNAQIPFVAGMVLVQKKNTVAARKLFERTLELAPQFVRALEEIVNLDIAENKFSEALDRLNKESDEKMGANRQLLLARVYIARARSVARKEAKSPDLKLNTPATQADVNLAEAALLKAVDLAPTVDGPYLLLAQLYVAAGKEQSALDRLNAYVSKTNNASAYMQIGVIHDELKDYPKARDAYEKAIAANPNFSPALNNLSYLYAERLNSADKALPLAEKARQLAPRDPSSEDTLGWIVFKRGDYARARALLEESASKMPNQPEIQYHLGMARYMLGDEEPARLALQQAAGSTEEFPGKEEAARRLAILAIDAKTADAKTQADLEKRLQDEPNDPIVAERLGEIYEKGGALEKAAKTYEQSLKQVPQNAPLMSRLTHIYIELNKNDKALELAKEAHKVAPGDAMISGMLGHLVFQTGDYNWAATLLQEAAAKLPNDPEIRYDVAWSQYSLGRVDEAEKTMQSAVPALNGSRLSGAKQFLTLVTAAKTPAQATTVPVTQILSTNADYVPAVMLAAIQAEQQSKFDDAGKLYSKALAVYPAFAPAARNLAVLSSRHPQADDQKAYDLALKSRALYSDDTELTRALGVLAYRRADYARAAQLLQDSSQTLNSDGELFYFLGKAHYQLKHMPQSKVALQRALALNIEAKSADDARKVLQELK